MKLDMTWISEGIRDIKDMRLALRALRPHGSDSEIILYGKAPAWAYVVAYEELRQRFPHIAIEDENTRVYIKDTEPLTYTPPNA